MKVIITDDADRLPRETHDTAHLIFEIQPGTMGSARKPVEIKKDRASDMVDADVCYIRTHRPAVVLPLGEPRFRPEPMPVSSEDWHALIEKYKPMHLTVEDIAWCILNPGKSITERPLEKDNA